MTDVERLKEVRTIIGHKSCPDGTAAAMICVRALLTQGLTPDVKFVQYDTNEHTELPAEPGQLFVDITPPVSRWRDWIEYRPIVLDHHDTAEEAVIGLNGSYGHPENSGATLAFEHVMRPMAAVLDQTAGVPLSHSSPEFERWEKFAHLCRIRDTWQDKHPDFEEGCGVSHGVMFYGSWDLVESARKGDVPFDKIWDVGKDTYEKLMRKAELYAKTAHRFEIRKGERTYKIGAFNCSERATSEAAHVLLEDGCDVAFGYFMLVEDGGVCLSVSLRSHKGDILVNEMAEKFGGGGHPPAAAFRIRDAAGMSLDDVCQAVAGALPE